MTDAREIIADELWPTHGRLKTEWADEIIEALTSAGLRILGPDEANLIETALQHASFALDGVVALDDEDEGKDGGSDTCQHAKRTVDRALRALKEKRT